MLDLSNPGSGSGWDLQGNDISGTSSVLGTTSADPLKIVTNGIERLTIDTEGRLIPKVGPLNSSVIIGNLAGPNMTTGSKNNFIGF